MLLTRTPLDTLRRSHDRHVRRADAHADAARFLYQRDQYEESALRLLLRRWHRWQAGRLHRRLTEMEREAWNRRKDEMISRRHEDTRAG